MVSQRFLAFPYSKSLAKSMPLLILPISSYIGITAITVAGAWNRRPPATAVAMNDDIDVFPMQIEDYADQQGGVFAQGREEESSLDQSDPSTSQIGGFAFESGAGVGVGVGFSSSSSTSVTPMEGEDQVKMVDRAINASIVLAAGTFAITKLLTIDMDYWHVGQSLPLSLSVSPSAAFYASFSFSFFINH